MGIWSVTACQPVDKKAAAIVDLLMAAQLHPAPEDSGHRLFS
jgi:hypothetical protein